MLYVSHHNLKTTEKGQYLVLGTREAVGTEADPLGGGWWQDHVGCPGRLAPLKVD